MLLCVDLLYQNFSIGRSGLGCVGDMVGCIGDEVGEGVEFLINFLSEVV